LPASCRYDAIVIGGGFYGASIAAYLGQKRPASVLLLEKQAKLLSRASYVNQARIHQGYHYPRSLQTAYRSRVSFARFVREFGDCVVSDFGKLYAIARDFSKVTPLQFERVCEVIGAPLRKARPEYQALFDSRLVEAVYEAVEYAFDATILCALMNERLRQASVEVCTGIEVLRLSTSGAGEQGILCLSSGEEVQAPLMFNCTYSGLRDLPGLRDQCRSSLKLELAEMALIEPPSQLKQLGITVMCGPVFSPMPFPPERLHTLSHVRYTPHCSWISDGGMSNKIPSIEQLRTQASNSLAMLRDSQRYVPALASARICSSIFELKALLPRNEVDDGRPILVERSIAGSTVVYSILGGKIDNIFDVLQRLDADGL
jgi:glycine/D-amino acid oxidase-like deaminating enzyme